MEENEGQEGLNEGMDAGGEAEADPIRNIKAEMDRKIGNLSEQNAQIKAALEAIVAQNAAKTKPPAETENLEDLVYSDPKRYAQLVEERAIQKASEAVTKQAQMSQATQGTIMSIQAQYPEFGQDNSEAAQLALRKFQTLPAHLKGTPEGAKMVLLEAASELGLVPANKRRRVTEESDDSFSLGGAGGQGTSGRRKTPAKLDPKTLAFAEAIGLDTSKPEVLKSLEERAQRDSWNKYR